MTTVRPTSVLCMVLTLLASLGHTQIVNGTFEQIDGDAPLVLTNPPRSPPAGWGVPAVAANDGWAVGVTVREEPGLHGALLYPTTDARPEIFGNLMQTIDAASLRGQRFRLDALVDFVEPGNATLQMWARVDRPGGARGFFDNMGDRPVRESGPRSVTIEGEVADDATSMSVGFMIQGGAGRAFVTNVRLTPLGAVGLGARPAAPLTGRALENVAAFARLSGLVRYFHPADAGLELDWVPFMVAGVDAVEGADGPEDLAETLSALFAPIAPTVQVWAGDATPDAVHLPASDEITAIRHRGLGPPLFETEIRPTIYSSERLREPRDLEGGSIPNPSFDTVVDLGAGVHARVPHVLPVDAGGTLPRFEADTTSTDSNVAAPDRPESWVADWRDRSFRLASVVMAWNVLEHFYPYWDVLDIDWDHELRDHLGQAALGEGADALGDVLERLVAAADDGHGNLMRNQAIKGFIPARVAWIGDQAVATVTAKATELQPGDTILSIDGSSVEERYRTAAEHISASTEGWRRSKAEMRILGLGGAPGAAATVRVRTADGNIVERSVTRTDPRSWFQLQEERPGLAQEIAPGIYYVDLNGLGWGELAPHMATLASAEGVVFDLRGYPSDAGSRILRHLTKETIHSAYWRVPTWVRPGLEHADFAESRWTLAPKQPHLGGRIVFVTGGGAISYAESVMAIVEAYELGEIVGARTAGTNGNINRVAIPGGFHLIWTGMRVVQHDGETVHQGVGVTPTIPTSRTIEGIAAGRDELIDRAIEVIQDDG